MVTAKPAALPDSDISLKGNGVRAGFGINTPVVGLFSSDQKSY